MMYTLVFIPFTIFLVQVSYVHCARKPPADFFDLTKEKDCVKLNHVMSHINYFDRSALSLDMICETEKEYDFASFAQPQPDVVRVDKDVIRIAKVEHYLTVITFAILEEKGQATLYFESLEDATNFNKKVYPPMRSSLRLQLPIGRIDRIATTQPCKYTKAVQFAKIYEEISKLNILKKFVIEADGKQEPILVFIQGEFNIAIDQRQDPRARIYKAKLKFGNAITYEIFSENNEERGIFISKMIKFTQQGKLLIE